MRDGCTICRSRAGSSPAHDASAAHRSVSGWQRHSWRALRVIGFVDRTALHGRKTGGPLACPECGRTEAGAPVTVGQPVSYGAVHLTNDGSEPAVLERVSLLDADPAMELVGVMILDIGREPAVGLSARLSTDARAGDDPSGRRIHASARPHETFFGVLVVVGAKIIANGRHRFRRIAVDYRVRRSALQGALRLESRAVRATEHLDVGVRGCMTPKARKRTASTATSESPP